MRKHMCTPARGRLGWRPPPVGWTTSMHTRQAASSGAGSVAVGVRPATLPILPAPPPLDPTLPRRYAEPAHGRRPPPATPRATLVGVPLATAAASPRGTCPRRRWAVAPARRDDRRRSVAAPRRPPSSPPQSPAPPWWCYHHHHRYDPQRRAVARAAAIQRRNSCRGERCSGNSRPRANPAPSPHVHAPP